jgi:HD-GYP domain-containing protein (c-di-GMP phosphodiesterase class II)
VNLIPFSKQYLRLNEALPFGLRDDSGRLLLAAGQRIDNSARLADMHGQALYADEHESSDWRRRLAQAVDVMVRQNAPLKAIAQARPVEVDAEREREREREAAHSEPPLAEQWIQLFHALDAALRELEPSGAWLVRLQSVHERVHTLAQRRLDGSLYHLIYTAGHSSAGYSSHHALLCTVMAGECARLAGWSGDEARSLERAALTMNVSMKRLQDDLVLNEMDLSPVQREQVRGHPVAGAALLQAAGVADALWLAVVRLHHEDSAKAIPLGELSAAQRLARLLRRVDIFAAKMSCRATRTPMSPVQAAREACLGADGRPDEIGAVLLKAVGMYPPGSFVELTSGERGIVVARGRRANLPLVALLVGAGGEPLGEPVLRDTVDRRHAVKGAVPSQSVRVRPPHDKLLAMR